MRLHGYVESPDEVSWQLAKAGLYHGRVREPVERRPPNWLLQPVERRRWNRGRKERQEFWRRFHEEQAAKRADDASAEPPRLDAQP